MKRDPRRFLPLIEWVNSLPVELSGDSAFQSTTPIVITAKFVILTTGSEQASGTAQFGHGNDAVALQKRV